MELALPEFGTNYAKRMVQRVLRDYPGNLAVRLWDDQTLRFGAGAPEVCLNFRHPGLLRDLVLSRDPLRLAEAYIQGELNVEGNIHVALGLKEHLQSLALSAVEKTAFAAGALFLGERPNGNNRISEAQRRPLPLRVGQAHSKDTKSTTGKGAKMTRHYQRGDAGAAMLIVMVVLMIGFFWHGGMGHGGDRAGHMSTAAQVAKSPLDTLDDAYARGEIGREEYLRKREDLMRR